MLWLPASRVGIKGACSLALRQKESADLQPTTQTSLKCGRQASALYGQNLQESLQPKHNRSLKGGSNKVNNLGVCLQVSVLPVFTLGGEGEPGQARRQHTQQEAPDPPALAGSSAAANTQAPIPPRAQGTGQLEPQSTAGNRRWARNQPTGPNSGKTPRATLALSYFCTQGPLGRTESIFKDEPDTGRPGSFSTKIQTTTAGPSLCEMGRNAKLPLEYIHMYMSVSVCGYIRIHRHIYTHTRMCIYTHTYINKP